MVGVVSGNLCSARNGEYTDIISVAVNFTEIENSVYTTTFCMLFIVTPIVIYAILQKKFTESLMSTSIVG